MTLTVGLFCYLCPRLFTCGALREQSTTHRPFKHERREHTKRVRPEIARIKAGTENELAKHGQPPAIERRRVIQLAELHRPTECERESGADSRARVGSQGAKPPGDHHRPERVAEQVAQRCGKPGPAPVHEQANGDSAQGKRDKDETRTER